MALEACSFQLSSTPLTTRACISKEKRLTNREVLPKRTPPPLSSTSISFSSLKISAQTRTSLICKATNTANQVVLEVTDDSWDELVLKTETPVVLVEFWAPSCGPCRMMEPVMDELAKEYAGKVAFFKINTDESLKMASKHGIRDIPTVLIFKDGEKKEGITGAVRKPSLSATIDKYVAV